MAPAHGYEAIRGLLENMPFASHFVGQRATMLASLASRFARSRRNATEANGNSRD
jgi:hypothetical protein